MAMAVRGAPPEPMSMAKAFRSIRMANFTRSAPSSSFSGRLPSRMRRFSPVTPSASVLRIWSADRWTSRSVTQKMGSPGSSPTVTVTTVPSFFATTPWMASGVVVH